MALVCLGLAACGHKAGGGSRPHPVVGTWVVKIPEAPFHDHVFVFHADGTMMQSNPDFGDPGTSDSNGMGAWVAQGDRVRGRFVEITADRVTHQFVSRGEISFSVLASGNALSGTASAVFFDAGGKRLRGPLPATITGERVVP